MAEQTTLSMQIGAAFDRSQALQACLARNAARLDAFDIAVPVPGSYRGKLKKLTNKLQGDPALPDEEYDLLHGGADQAHSVIFMSDIRMMSSRGYLYENGRWFPRLAESANWVRNALPMTRVHFCMAVQNPATYLTEALASGNYPRLMETPPDPFALSWHDILGQLREACPDVPITVWRAEQQPFLWPQILKASVGLEDKEVELDGVLDPLDGIMTEAGIERTRAYLEENRRKLDAEAEPMIIRTFLNYYGIDGAQDEVIDLPGWTPDKTQAMTAHYEADMVRVAALYGVRLLTV